MEFSWFPDGKTWRRVVKKKKKKVALKNSESDRVQDFRFRSRACLRAGARGKTWRRGEAQWSRGSGNSTPVQWDRAVSMVCFQQTFYCNALFFLVALLRLPPPPFPLSAFLCKLASVLRRRVEHIRSIGVRNTNLSCHE